MALDWHRHADGLLQPFHTFHFPASRNASSDCLQDADSNCGFLLCNCLELAKHTNDLLVYLGVQALRINSRAQIFYMRAISWCLGETFGCCNWHVYAYIDWNLYSGFVCNIIFAISKHHYWQMVPVVRVR